MTIGTKERKFQKKISEGGEDYYKIQHIPLIQFPNVGPPEPEASGCPPIYHLIKGIEY
ncbi:unnamed protein product [Arabidopsis halleri]